MPVNNIPASAPVPTSDLSIDQADIQRRMQLADMLQQQSMSAPPNETVMGRVVKQSPVQGLARLAQALASSKIRGEASNQTRELQAMQQQRLAETLQAMSEGNPEVGKYSALYQNPETRALAAQLIGKAMEDKVYPVGSSLMDKRGTVLGTDQAGLAEKEAIRLQRAQDQESARQQRMELAQQQEALRRDLAAQSSADRRMIAGMVNARQEQKNVPKLPTAALKLQQEELDAIGTASSINADLSALEKQIDDKKLDLGLMKNLASKAKNYVGASDEQSRNFGSFQATLEKMRNDSLRLNKGVQTEGDAVRAWNELIANINDPKLVKQRLGDIQRINERAANLRAMNVENIRSNFGVEPLNTSGYKNQPAAVGGGANVDALLKKYGG